MGALARGARAEPRLNLATLVSVGGGSDPAPFLLGNAARAPRIEGRGGKETLMPAKSKAQQKAAGAALAAKRGQAKKSALKGASRQMYESMSEQQLDEFASTKRRGKPDYAKGSPVPAKKAARKKAAKKAAATRAKNAKKKAARR